jgi:hypothetical protein
VTTFTQRRERTTECRRCGAHGGHLVSSESAIVSPTSSFVSPGRASRSKSVERVSTTAARRSADDARSSRKASFVVATATREPPKASPRRAEDGVGHVRAGGGAPVGTTSWGGRSTRARSDPDVSLTARACASSSPWPSRGRLALARREIARASRRIECGGDRAPVRGRADTRRRCGRPRDRPAGA